MNKRENILNAWIMMEQLSEGSISKTDKAMKTLDMEAKGGLTKFDWRSFFEKFLNEQKELQKISDGDFKKAGIALYFDIFDFQEVINVFEEKYQKSEIYEEVSKSNKFAISLRFDHQLNFLAEKLFLTMSGAIRDCGKVPDDFKEVEDRRRIELSDGFEKDFNKEMDELSKKYKVSADNFRYAFLKDLDGGNVSLHSFFIEDLRQAKRMGNKNLGRYFSGFTGERRNLDGNAASPGFNPTCLEEVLQPKHYTHGRFPSNPDYALSFMQQAAVILTLPGRENDMCGVNGPPGTGKTTLLKDVFADLAVSQALSICNLPEKYIRGELGYWKQAKLGSLPTGISEKNIVVSSSNNGAVQNIVNELPKKDGIADEFKGPLEEADYFQDVSNSGSPEGENWGMFSMEGGSAANVEKMQQAIEGIEQYLETKYESNPSVYGDFKKLFGKLESEIKRVQNLKDQGAEIDFTQEYGALQKSNPWFDKEFRILQSRLFISSLKVRKQFLFENRKNLKAAREVWTQQEYYASRENGRALLTSAWQWLNLAIPVVSTTFASFGRMFRNIQENSIGNLFVDEAGQALPQAGVGAIFRSRRIVAVGDPFQIKPVLTLDAGTLAWIRELHDVDERFVSTDASVQSLMDAASQYGFEKGGDTWIGIPLWVHRRCNDPMFTISNRISYDDLMVQGKPQKDAQGKAFWHHVPGPATDKFVSEQAKYLRGLIEERMKEDPALKHEIYVISPFKNVASKLEAELDEIPFTKREKGKATNVGTIHTFQGKEAEIVYLVLGADRASRGAAAWSVAEPNMMNVAATRAKSEFHIIGDKELYKGLKNKTVDETISIIDQYSERNKPEAGEEGKCIMPRSDLNLVDGEAFAFACASKDFLCSERRIDDLYVSYINACMGSPSFDGYRISFDDFRNELFDSGYFKFVIRSLEMGIPWKGSVYYTLKMGEKIFGVKLLELCKLINKNEEWLRGLGYERVYGGDFDSFWEAAENAGKPTGVSERPPNLNVFEYKALLAILRLLLDEKRISALAQNKAQASPEDAVTVE